MELDELLREVRRRRLILLQHGVLWSPNTPVPGATRRAIVQHRPALLHLIKQGDIRVCADCELHRPYWKHAGSGRYVCDVCARIAV